MPDPSRNDATIRPAGRARSARGSRPALSPTREAEIVDELSQHLDRSLSGADSRSGSSLEDAASLDARRVPRAATPLARHMAPASTSPCAPPATPAAPTRSVDHRPLAGRALCRAHVPEAAGLHRDGRPHARAWHRRQHGNLQRRLRRVAEAAAFPRTRSAGQPDPHRARLNLRTVNHGPATYFTYRRQPAVVRGPSEHGKPTRCRSRAEATRSTSTCCRSATPPCPSCACNRFSGGCSRRRRHARHPAARRPDPRLLAAPVRRRRPCRRAVAVDRWRASGDHRRAAGVVQVPPRRRQRSSCRCSWIGRRPAIEFDFQVLARLKPGVTLHRRSADVGRMIPLLPQPFAQAAAAAQCATAGR